MAADVAGPVTPARLIKSAATLRPGDVLTEGAAAGRVVKGVSICVYFDDGSRSFYPVDVVVDRDRPGACRRIGGRR